MTELLFLLALVVVLPLGLPAFSLLLLTLASCRGGKQAVDDPSQVSPAGARVAVLVPAHNESIHVLPTLACLKSQAAPGDRIVLIADNCSDDTAELARQTGVEVIERHDTTRRGKGFALAFGVAHLRADPPDVVVVVDADCILSEQALPRITRLCHSTGRPVQMLNLMIAGPGAALKMRVLEFAALMKNLVRPMGSNALAQVCHLSGTGMALPWSLMSTVKLATGHIAEDMEMGISLAIAGHTPRFLPGVRVTSDFPLQSEVAKAQKTRWEHGHLKVLREDLPRLAKVVFRTWRLDLLVLMLDLMIPPVALYALVLSVSLALSAVAAWLWPVLGGAALLLAVAALSLFLAIGITWVRHGRELLSARELLIMPLYVLGKIPIYLAYLIGRRSGWVKTKR
ncbi:glycosyltransferase family 2 protein [Curvibacter gracilis]|uniref:glycosyltransferase family 2 protein n=1 Tax=Curvibacter gracilis TaxID=230310 RepID=UPI0004839D39|nr:glycosyltransferase [Curvibacter gracilis]